MTNPNISLEDRITQAREEAHKTAEEFGVASPEHAVASDTLEELLAEEGHKRKQQNQKSQNALERFCGDNPEAPECRIDDN
jgi:hypothetical protein